MSADDKNDRETPRGSKGFSWVLKSHHRGVSADFSCSLPMMHYIILNTHKEGINKAMAETQATSNARFKVGIHQIPGNF